MDGLACISGAQKTQKKIVKGPLLEAGHMSCKGAKNRRVLEPKVRLKGEK